MVRLVLIVAAVSLCSAALAGVVTGHIVKSNIDAGSRAQQHRLFVAQVNGCYRQNQRTVVSNRNALATWRLDSLFAMLLAVPSRHQTRRGRQEVRVFVARLNDTVSSLTWTPVNRTCALKPTLVLLPVAFGTRSPSKADL